MTGWQAFIGEGSSAAHDAAQTLRTPVHNQGRPDSVQTVILFI